MVVALRLVSRTCAGGNLGEPAGWIGLGRYFRWPWMLLLAGTWLEMLERDCADQNDGQARVGQAERRYRDQKVDGSQNKAKKGKEAAVAIYAYVPT